MIQLIICLICALLGFIAGLFATPDTRTDGGEQSIILYRNGYDSGWADGRKDLLDHEPHSDPTRAIP